RTRRPPRPSHPSCGPRERRPACRNSGAPPLRRFRAPAGHSLAASRLISHAPDRPHFDSAMTGGGTARRPGDCGVKIGHIDDVVAAKLLLGLGVGAVEDLWFAIG